MGEGRGGGSRRGSRRTDSSRVCAGGSRGCGSIPRRPIWRASRGRCALLAAPVVFAVTAPRTPAIDAALVEQDLVVLVTGDPDGALAAAAVAGLGRVVTARPLSRGLGRELSRAGVRPAAPIRTLLQAGGRR